MLKFWKESVSGQESVQKYFCPEVHFLGESEDLEPSEQCRVDWRLLGVEASCRGDCERKSAYS